MDEDMINNLSSMLKNGNIPYNIKEMVSNFSNTQTSNNADSSSTNIDPNMISSLLSSISQDSSNNSNSTEETTNSNIDFETIMKMKTIIEKINQNKNDPRANLLRSLKPYLRTSRKDKLEQYVKLLNMSSVIDVFGMTGGEKKK